MPKKRKLASLDDKCRICLSDDGCMSDIFSELLRPKITDLGRSASIPIDDGETLPRNICHVCLYKLDMWIEFKEQFVRSNAMLREHLEQGELSDNKASPTKRKHSESLESPKDDSIQQGNAKKLKSDSPTPTDCAGSNLKTEKKRESNEERKAAVEDSQKAKVDSDMTSDVIPVATEVAQKVKQIAGRRAKTTERRKESTRRWVARKKALLAATGENDTDTDSMVSEDEQQLSPVQKARAKCNAEKVAAESHRRMTRAMQNLDSNISGYYGTNADSESYVIQDSDSEARNDRTNCAIKTEAPTDGGGGGGGDARLPSNSVSNASPRPNNSIAENPKNPPSADDGFVPHSVRSELIIDGVTFVVTSTLVLSEPHYLNPAQTNNSSSLPGDEATQQERNTDIIDAVQLRRVSPKNELSRSESTLIDTCLNIEVEGTELDSLQRVQSELAKFVEKGLRNKLVDEGEDDDDAGEKIEAKVNDAFQTLDQQLKTIVEKTIKKNLENARTIDNRGNNTFTGEFLKAAVRSKIFQPRVYLVRCDVNCANPLRQKNLEKPRKTRKSNVLQDVAKTSTKATSKKIEEPPPPPPPLGKRRSIQPAKYADYNTSPFDSEGEEIEATSQVVTKKPPPTTGPKLSKVKTYGPAAPKPAQTPPPSASQPKPQQSLLLPQKPAPEKPASNSVSEKHICGVCGDAFSTRKEVETHFGTHKKQKMMRCKRCHEIVDARLVKSHVCSASKNLHKCSSCTATFRTEQLLARHAESHELERETATRVEKTSGAEAKNVHETNDADSAKNVAQSERNEVQLAAESRDRESYTCFVCDKTFTDEELLKDHLQKHCDDMSEDERSSNAKEYQCAICGEALESEDALETHVEKHLFDDEDDNPNLISIGGGGDAEKNVGGGGGGNETLHSCGQCSETFDSEMLLMLHMQAHEEEVAIAEWERRGIDNSQEEQHVCVICDDIFATEDELSEHLDIHNGNAHICILCDKPFLTLEELQSHVNTH